VTSPSIPHPGSIASRLSPAERNSMSRIARASRSRSSGEAHFLLESDTHSESKRIRIMYAQTQADQGIGKKS
jgi:hypothetical protein